MSTMNRRMFLAAGAASAAMASMNRVATGAASTAASSTKASTQRSAVPDGVVWHDVREWGIEGKGFADTERFYDRLPARAKGVVRNAIWSLSHDTSGMSVRFE